jgi:fibronectin-binding autotransporter adhesin
MSDVFGSYCRNRIVRSKRARKALLMAAASTALAVTAAHANTELDVLDGTPNLSTLSPTSSNDLTFTSGGTYTTTSYNDGAATLTLGSLVDLDGTQDLLIADTGPIVLSGGSNSVVGPQTTDVLYVASGGTLDLSGVPLTLVPTTATLDVVGTANIGTWSALAGTTYTFNGGGTTNVSATNSATFLGSLVLNSGTLVNNATAALGAGTIFLGGTSGSANATIVEAANANIINPIVVQSGSTGTLRLTGQSPAGTATFAGAVTLNGNVTLGNGGNSTEGATVSGIISGAGSILVDAGASTITLSGSNSFTGGVTAISGTLALASNGNALGTSTLTLGALNSADNVVLATGVGSFGNKINIPAGNTGTIRIENAAAGSFALGGAISVGTYSSPMAAATLTIGAGGTTTGTVSYTTQVSGAIQGSGTVILDPGVYGGTSPSTPNIILLRTAGPNFYGNIDLISGELLTTGGSSSIGKNAYLTIDAGTDFVTQVNQQLGGLEDPASGGSGTITSNLASGSIALTFSGITATTQSFSGQFVAGTASINLATGSAFVGTQIIAGTQTINGGINTLGGTLTLTGNDTIALPIGAGGGFLLLQGNDTFGSGTIQAGAILNATAAPTQGTLTLNGTNTFPSGAEATAAFGTLSTNNLQPNGTPSAIGVTGSLTLGSVIDWKNTSTNVITAALNAGTLLYTGPSVTTNLVINGSGSSTINTYGSIVAMPSLGNLNVASTGTLTLTGQSFYAGTTTLASGTLDLDAAENAGTSGPIGNGSTVNFAGGTLQYSSANQYDYSSRFSTAAGQKYNVDTNGQAITFASPLTSSTGSLTVSDSVGTGSLLLTGANTFSGSVTVNSGDLVMGSASAIGAPLATNGGTASYYLGKAAGTVNAGALDLNGNSISGERLNLAGTGNNNTGALINSGGAATIGLGSGIGTFQIASVGSGTTSTGTVTISATGITGFSATGSIGATSITSAAGSGYTAAGTVSVSGGGGTGMTVSTSVSLGTISFTLTNSGTGYTSIPTFTLNGATGGTGAAVTAATLGLTSVTVNSWGTANAGFSLSNLPTLTLSNSGLATAPTIAAFPVEVSLNGAATIGGTGDITIVDPITQTAGQNYGITKVGSNTLTLSGSSIYTGSTTVNSGTVNVTGALADSGTITLSGTGDVVLAGANALLSTAPITVGSTSNLFATSSQTLASIASTGSTTFSAGSSIVGQGNGIGTGAGGASTTGGITGTGTLNVTGGSLTSATIRQATLNVGDGASVTIADSTLPAAVGLSVSSNTAATSVLTDLLFNGANFTTSATGSVDLKNNDMIINDASQHAYLISAIAHAYDNGNWDMSGLTSSSAAANHTVYGLGYATGAELGTTSFDGQPITSGSTVVKYTLLGDTTLKGAVTGGDYSTVVANFGKTGQDWSQGNFFNVTSGPSVTGSDYSTVVANFGKTASGNVVTAMASPALTRAVTPDVQQGSASDMHLEVNTTTGDVQLLAETSMTLSLYAVYDSSSNLRTGQWHKLSTGTATASTGVTYTPANWAVAGNSAGALGEGQNQGSYNSTVPSTFDNIALTAGQTIDLGNIFKTTTNSHTLSFEFQEPNASTGDPVNGYQDFLNGTTIDYIGGSTPEPGTLGTLGLGGIMMMRRRKRNSGKSAAGV